jgi:hypothetical protein
MCHFTNGKSWNKTSAFVVGRLRDFRLSLRRPLLFFLDRGIGVMLYSVNFTPTHLGANRFATSPGATTVYPVYNVSTNALRIARKCRRFRHGECLRDL